jgi:hypothetical protein
MAWCRPEPLEEQQDHTTDEFTPWCCLILEVLIIVMMPAMVALVVAVHAWAPSTEQQSGNR